ncbi:MAG: PLP-dependent aminotransferase family protein [Acidobacteriota bacterium]
MKEESTEPIDSRPPSGHAAAGRLAPSRVDPDAKAPLYRQIYDGLRLDILAGALRPGQRLASTRAMAQELGVSRNTVLEAIDQLTAEGYLVGRAGSGTFVTDRLPDDLLRTALPGREAPAAGPDIARRGHQYRQWAQASRSERARPFQLGRPAVDRFPWPLWWRLSAKRGRTVSPEWLDYSPSAGYPPLRRALADYLRRSRGLACSPEQILIVRGSQQGLDLAARVLLDPGDAVWMEDPGYGAAEVAFAAGGARLVRVPVDKDGLDVDAGRRLEPAARLAYVTPSHQYPLGVTLSLARRLRLLEWARSAGAWVVEDDYDSEYRYEGRPLASLAGLDGGGTVIYLGTLSKVLFPALRLGYLVVPEAHLDAFVGARYASDRHTSILEQAVVADFLDGGHFDRHIRRMRVLYAERQAALADAAGSYLGGALDLQSSPTGLHDVGWLGPGLDDRRVAAAAAERGVFVGALSNYGHRPMPPALLFGYAGFPAESLRRATEDLARVLDGLGDSSRAIGAAPRIGPSASRGP